MLENPPICRLVYIKPQLGFVAAVVRKNPFALTGGTSTFWIPAG
jgi:hypothetical protein